MCGNDRPTQENTESDPYYHVWVNEREVRLPNWAILTGAARLELETVDRVDLEGYANSVGAFLAALLDDGFCIETLYGRDSADMPQYMRNMPQWIEVRQCQAAKAATKMASSNF
jgi:hypothetical protein